MKKISTLFIVIMAVTMAITAQPARTPQQVQARAKAAIQRIGQQNRLSEEDIMAACPDSVVTWDTDDNGSLAPNTKTVYTYDSKKRIATETEYEWEKEWEIIKKTTNTYEGDKLAYVMVEDTEDWFGTGKKKVSYTYDAAGRVTLELTQNVQNDGSLTDDYRHTYTYDEQGRETEDLDETWNGSYWQKSTKTVTSYEGDKSIITEYGWDGSEWVAGKLFRHLHQRPGADLPRRGL